MYEHEPNGCNDLISYLMGEGSELERAAFEKHLLSCASCREELQEMKLALSALPFQMEVLEAPEDLEADVMAAIDKLGQNSTIPLTLQTKKRSFPLYWIAGLISAVVVGVVIGVVGNQAVNPKPVQPPVVQSSAPTELLKSLQLNTADNSMPLATGIAWVMKQGDSQVMIIQLQGLKETQGESAYQAWLIKNGRRYNCGTFYVDASGSGILTYKLDPRFADFDAIGVTLEPDANGKQPRGSKVLGT
ncbi:MAG: hypothetical protein K0R67_2468 [Paenibacillus sp.]|jgi:hypothetical protein|nr:hypothetical protein [Paenibacillus sp.]